MKICRREKVFCNVTLAEANSKMQRRLRLRDWLVVQIESGNFLGLEWIDKERRIFRVPWKHGSRQSWKEDVDAAVFREWAIYTGRYDIIYLFYS